jgi:methionyl-tRNA formyltransferase
MTNSLRDLPILFIAARIVGKQCLTAALDAGANVAGLLYLDDRKADATVAHTKFDDVIAKHQLRARSFASLKGDDGATHLDWAKSFAPRLGVVCGVSELIKGELLTLPDLGFIGMHPTMLPIGRGRAPIPWAIILGLKETGVTWFYVDPGADTGDILIQQYVPVLDNDTSSTLGARTDDVAASLLGKALPLLAGNRAPRIKQDESAATVWPRRKPEDGIIDWSRDAGALCRWIRALTHPYPGAFTFLTGRRLWIWSAERAIIPLAGAPGEVLAVDHRGAIIATGKGLLNVTQVQWEGRTEASPLDAGIKPRMRLGQLVNAA